MTWRLNRGATVRLCTADKLLGFMGAPPIGRLFCLEVEAYLAITGAKAYVLGEGAVGDRSFVSRLRAGHSPFLRTVDRVRRWMGTHSSAPERRTIGAATLHAAWWRLGVADPAEPAAMCRAAPTQTGLNDLGVLACC